MTTPSTGQLRINAKYHWLTFMFSMFRPRAIINGYEVALQWGDNEIPAPLGQHQVTVFVPYLWKVGTAAAVVDNTRQVPLLYYAAPVWTFSKGAIGTQPQRHPALTATYIAYAVLAVVLVACCIGTALSGSGQPS